MTIAGMMTLARGTAALRAILKRKRDDKQGGYHGRENGKWDFISSGLSGISPEEMDALFALAGIVPDEIVSKGDCKDCKHAVKKHNRWGEQGYEGPCLSCARPQMSNFVPCSKLDRKKRS